MKVGELALRFGCEVVGDPETEVVRVATLQRAGEGDLSFLSNPNYRQYLSDTGASAVIVKAAFADQVPGTAIIADDPYLMYARMAACLYPPRPQPAGIDPQASVAGSADIDDTSSVAARAVIGEQVVIGPRVRIGAGVVIGAGCRVAADSVIEPNVVLMEDVHVGERCLIHAGAIIGTDGFGIARAAEGWIKVPQVGGVRIGNDVEIGAATSIDRGAIEHTEIHDGVKLDNQIQIGHNSIIGEHTVMAGMVGIAGSTTIGRNCVFGGNSGTTGHLSIADGVVITARCTVTGDIPEAGTFGGVFPHEEFRQYQRNLARYRQLDKLARRVAALEKNTDKH